MPVTDGRGQRWYTVREVAELGERTPRTIKRWLRAYRQECRIVREGQHPRRVLIMPERIASRILDGLLSSPFRDGAER